MSTISKTFFFKLATTYVYNKGEKDYPKTFAGLTKRDGSFIVSRTKIDNFTLNDLKGKHIIGGRKGGMPEMTLEYTLKENGIDPKKDLTIDTSIAFSAMSGAFIGGTGDFVTLFEPNALELTKQNLGYTVAYLGALGGEVPYTAYNARKSYIEKNPDIIMIMGSYWPKKLTSMRLGFEATEASSQELLKAFTTERQGWSDLKAVENKQVYSAHHGLPREVFDAAVFEYLAKTFYPEEFADVDPEGTLKEFYDKFLPFSYGGVWFMHLN